MRAFILISNYLKEYKLILQQPPRFYYKRKVNYDHLSWENYAAA